MDNWTDAPETPGWHWWWTLGTMRPVDVTEDDIFTGRWVGWGDKWLKMVVPAPPNRQSA